MPGLLISGKSIDGIHGAAPLNDSIFLRYLSPLSDKEVKG
jgi:hypothetical protein